MNDFDLEELLKEQQSPDPAPVVAPVIGEPDLSSYDSNIAKASDDAERQRKMSYIMQAMQTMGTANAQSRGMAAPSTKIFEEMRTGAGAPVDAARAEKQAAIKAYLDKKKLDWQQNQAAQEERRHQEMLGAKAKESEAAMAFKGSEGAANRDLQLTIAGVRNADKQAAEAEKQQAKDEALTVEGYGKARTPKEAQELRQTTIDTKSALDDLRAVKELGNNVAIWDRTKVNKIDQLLNQAVGKLRMSMVGPGSMTESERLLIRESIGDPTALFSSESIQNAKLDQLIANMEKRLEDEAKAKIVGYGGKAPAGGKKVTRKEVSASTGKTRVTYDDGTTEIIEGK